MRMLGALGVGRPHTALHPRSAVRGLGPATTRRLKGNGDWLKRAKRDVPVPVPQGDLIPPVFRANPRRRFRAIVRKTRLSDPPVGPPVGGDGRCYPSAWARVTASSAGKYGDTMCALAPSRGRRTALTTEYARNQATGIRQRATVAAKQLKTGVVFVAFGLYRWWPRSYTIRASAESGLSRPQPASVGLSWPQPFIAGLSRRQPAPVGLGRHALGSQAATQSEHALNM